jgi:hypothetical protein
LTGEATSANHEIELARENRWKAETPAMSEEKEQTS